MTGFFMNVLLDWNGLTTSEFKFEPSKINILIM